MKDLDLICLKKANSIKKGQFGGMVNTLSLNADLDQLLCVIILSPSLTLCSNIAHSLLIKSL